MMFSKTWKRNVLIVAVALLLGAGRRWMLSQRIGMDKQISFMPQSLREEGREEIVGDEIGDKINQDIQRSLMQKAQWDVAQAEQHEETSRLEAQSQRRTNEGKATGAEKNLFNCDNVTQIPLQECRALLDLWSNTNGEGRIHKANWRNTVTPCDRYGVICEQTDGNRHVIALNFVANHMVGTIPASIGDFPYLRVLIMANNLDNNVGTLVGPIPNSIGNLSNLVSLNLYQNGLTGPLPQSIGNLGALQILNLWGNNIHGAIPAIIANLTNLQGISLSYNKLSGLIPSDIGNLVNLNSLSLSNNKLTGPIPSSIGNLVNLTQINLGANMLNGAIPASIGNLVNLTQLSLGINKLDGGIPGSIGNLANLSFLSLMNNKIGGVIPDSIGNLSNLQDFNIGGNNICGKVPETLMNLPQFQKLSVWFNRFTTTNYSPSMNSRLATFLSPSRGPQYPQLCPPDR